MAKRTTVVVCPGRGSYSKEHLGSLRDIHSPSLDAADQLRTYFDRPTVRNLDAATRFSGRLHLAGENASILTATMSMVDYEQMSSERLKVLAIGGNSMGHYTALGLTQVLSTADCLSLIETMGQYQADNIIGGQIVYPLVDNHWRIIPERKQLVDELCKKNPNLFWSIYLGGQAILGGTEDALKTAQANLPAVQQGQHQFPLRLPLHSAFHTPLLESSSQRAYQELGPSLTWRQPSIPLIDGQGSIWFPKASSLQQLADYTLGHQVVESYNFTQLIKSAIRNFAPDTITLLGPGSNLGSAIAQVLIEEKWRGLTNKEDFLTMQREDPFLLAMGRSEQRLLVVQ